MIAVVQTLKPLPVVQTAPYIVFAGWTGFLIGWAFLFRHISVLWPQAYWTCLWRLALLIWFFSLFFFEFQGPYNLVAEPIPLLALELLFWAICAAGASAVIVAMIGRTRIGSRRPRRRAIGRWTRRPGPRRQRRTVVTPYSGAGPIGSPLGRRARDLSED